MDSAEISGDELRSAQRDLLRGMIAVTGWTATELARAAAIAPSTVNRPLAGETKHALSSKTLAALKAAVMRRLNDVADPPAARRQWRAILRTYDPMSVADDDDDGTSVAVTGYVGAGAEVIPFDDHATGEGIDKVRCPANLDPTKVVAVRVRGDSLWPIDDGWDIFYRKDVDGVTPDAVGKLCVVKLMDGRMFVKHVVLGSAAGRFTLLSSNAAPIQNVELRWAARVLNMVPGLG